MSFFLNIKLLNLGQKIITPFHYEYLKGYSKTLFFKLKQSTKDSYMDLNIKTQICSPKIQ